jgi:hypothetical protein
MFRVLEGMDDMVASYCYTYVYTNSCMFRDLEGMDDMADKW